MGYVVGRPQGRPRRLAAAVRRRDRAKGHSTASRAMIRRRAARSCCLHDAGGDRSHTVAALPRIIDDLRAKRSRVRAGFRSSPAGRAIRSCRRFRRKTWRRWSTASCSSRRAGSRRFFAGSLCWRSGWVWRGSCSCAGWLCGTARARRMLRRYPARVQVSRCSFRRTTRRGSSAIRCSGSSTATIRRLRSSLSTTARPMPPLPSSRERFGSDPPRHAPHDRQRRQGESHQRRPRVGAWRGRGGSRCRHAIREEDDCAARPLVRRSQDRRRRRQRQGRQPHQHADALAGARVHHLAELGAPGAWQRSAASPWFRAPSAHGGGKLW